MRKVCPILTAVLCLTLLAGCANEPDNITEAPSVSEDTVSKASVTESSEPEFTEEEPTGYADIFSMKAMTRKHRPVQLL